MLSGASAHSADVSGQSSLAVVLVCHNSAAQLQPGLEALSRQLEPDDELVVVDNASEDRSIELVKRVAPRARWVRTARNLGCAGSCAVGARETGAPLLFLLNPDAVVAPGALRTLCSAAGDRAEWGAWQALVTVRDGERVNTTFNVAHYLGIGWAGGLGRDVDEAQQVPHDVGFASGAALAVRRRAWDGVGGFEPRYFVYCEGLDLTLRLRVADWPAGVVPPARVARDYDFAKGDSKSFYVERNRRWTLLGVYPAPLLALLVPALAVFELAIVGAWRGGWLRAKLRAQRAVARELPAILRRRRSIQRTRTVTVRDFARALSASTDSPYLPAVSRIPGVAAPQRAFFGVVLALLGNEGQGRPR
jgi:GT2 family glycosyltransferase